MSVNLTVNGTVYPFPNTNDENWGDQVTSWATAISQATLQKNGGVFTLSADVDFGASAGLKALYLKSRATNPGTTGVIRLGNLESITWRNFANGADLALLVNASDRLQYGADTVVTAGSTDTLTNKSISAATNTITGLAKTDVGLANVDNTSDVNKPISTATATALALKANLASPTFTGTVGLPSGQVLTSPVLNTSVSGTAVLNENNMVSNSATQLATQSSIKAYVDSAVSAAGNVAYSAKSADYTVTTIDAIRTVGMTTGATTRTVTLPAAASSTNRILTIKKIDSGSGQVIIDANASELIDGALTLKLFLITESTTIQCDGTGWAVLDYKENNKWQTYTPTFSVSLGSVTSINFLYRRSGGSVQVKGTFNSGTATSAIPTVSLPSGLTIATSSVVAQRTILGNGAFGQAVAQYTTAANTILYAFYDGSANTSIELSSRTNTSGLFEQSNADGIIGNNAKMNLTLDIPVTEWA